ncbi:hypothetical protein JTB14_005639 [Gonioctena quinquepunctata]|nr:hypothetical protein JTB14_005639 [Gonioctena quinquepunctata]
MRISPVQTHNLARVQHSPQLHRIVAAGTLAYTWWSSTRQYQSYGRNGGSYSAAYEDIPTTFQPSYDTNERREPPRKRKKNGDQCSICLGTLAKDLKTLTCCHVFHSHCISTWLIDNNTCPLCRKVNKQ